jgi:sensor histidine kinase YesM
VHFSIENSKPEKVPIADPNRRSGGIGLVNVHRRLNLMYSNNYELKIDNNPKTYIVDLTIELDE